ncbi:hypothetical protein HNQ39_005912 [Armatimonas rosea]|uniref:Uncharacterized protein n=1 Tax=Armatimonas rosea TaxID=685828 RepID=A0A7W9SWD4_ARMRO|nr:hypothetical protein [Armatimonas rosea]
MTGLIVSDHREGNTLAHTSCITRTRGAANQKATTVTQRIIDSLNHAGSTLKFVTDAVLPIRKESLIGSVSICVDETFTVRIRQLLVELTQPVPLAIPDYIAQNLAAIARNSSPEPEILAFADTQLIDLYRVLGKGNQFREVGRFFLAMLLTVVQLTPKMRKMTLIGTLSSRAASMSLTFCGSTLLGFGLGVKVFLQSRHRHLSVPPRLVPCLTRASLLLQ